MSNPPTILFQAPNGIGLGHINRMVAIALAVRKRDPAAVLPIVVEGGSHSLIETASLSYLTLPHGPLLRNPDWSYTEWGAAVVFDTSRTIIQGLGPDLIVFDSLPCQPFLAAAARMKVPMALCARKTLDHRAYFDSILKQESLYQLIIIPHEPGEVEVPDRLISRTRFVGTIVRPVEAAQAATTRSRKQLVITGGGGGFPKTVDFYNLALESYARYRAKKPDLDCVLVAGPLFRKWWELRITENVRVIPFEPQMRELIAGADLVICQAGYNTVSEIKQLGVPCICLPAVRGFDDQFARAHETAKSAPQFHVYEENDPDGLARLIESCLGSPGRSNRESRSTSDGADQAAALLLDCVANAKRPGPLTGQHRMPLASPPAGALPSAAAVARNPNNPSAWGRIRRNEPCPCGSGKKYKVCHGRSA